MGLNVGPLRSANNQESKQLGNLVAGKTNKAKAIDEPIEEEYYYDEEEEEDDEAANLAAVMAYERGGGGLQFEKGLNKNGGGKQ